MKLMLREADYLLKGLKHQMQLLRAISQANSKNEKLLLSTSKHQVKTGDKEFYDDLLSIIYEKAVNINTFGQHSRWRNSFIRHLAPFENNKILDAAGGTGLTTREILAHSAKIKSELNFSITLCDHSLGMMKICQNKIEHLKDYKKLVNLVESDIHNLPFKNDTFDMATFTFSFRTGVDIQQVFKELVRVVKPGGRVGVLDFCYSKNPTMVQWSYNIFLDHIYSKIAYLLWNKPEVAYYIADNIRKSPSKDEVVEMLKSAGFHQISTKAYMGGVTYHYIGYKINQNVP